MEKLKTYYSYNSQLENGDMIAERKIPKDAVYEVIKIVAGKPLFFEDHMERLMGSIKNMGYSMNTSYEKISYEKILHEIVILTRANMNKNTNVRLVYIPIENKNTFDFMISFTEGLTLSPIEQEEGVAVETMSIERQDPNVKTMGTSYKDRIKTSSKYTDTFELLLVNAEGYITEGSRSNVFFVKDNKVITSPAQKVLLGVTRKYIIELCNKNNIQVDYYNLSEEDVYHMDGAFLTGTTVDVVPIRKVNDIKFQENNKIVSLLKEEYEAIMKEYIENFEVN